MAEAKGLSKPVKLKSDCEAGELIKVQISGHTDGELIGARI